MSYTPVELRHVRVRRSLFGYHRATVEQVIEEVAQSFEATWRERGELADQVENLEKQLGEHKRREDLLTQTLIAAEQAASDVRERARREADAIIAEAHNEARAIGRSAHAKREQLLAESQRIEAMLRAALGVIEERTLRMPPTTVASIVEPPPAPVRHAKPADEAELPMMQLPTLPPVIEDAPVSSDWREDTREFAPIVEPEASLSVSEPEASLSVAEPEASLSVPEPEESFSVPEPEERFGVAESEASLRVPEPESSFSVAAPETSFGVPEPEASYGLPEPPAVVDNGSGFDVPEASLNGTEASAAEPEREPEPELAVKLPVEPVLQRTPGRESRDFDWGE
jgi:cell division initiation protein